MRCENVKLFLSEPLANSRDSVHKFLTAIQHLTISKRNYKASEVSSKEIQQSLVCFPLAGFYIGLILVSINFLASMHLPDQVINVFIVFFLVVFTGQKHLKGCIAMVCNVDDFLKTQSIPSKMMVKIFIILFFILMLKYISLNNIVPGWKNEVLIIMPVLGRWSLIFFPYLTQSKTEGNLKDNPLYGEIKIKDFWVGTFSTSLLVLLLLGINGILIFMMVSFLTVFFERLYSKIENGIPEYLSLAIVEITEIATLIFFIILESSTRNILSEGILV